MAAKRKTTRSPAGRTRVPEPRVSVPDLTEQCQIGLSRGKMRWEVRTDGFIRPAQALRAAVNWAWLRWHQEPDFRVISRSLSGVVRRGLELYAPGTNFGTVPFRDLHNSFLLQCAVLSGDSDVMRDAAVAVLEAKLHCMSPATSTSARGTGC
jgi:hypothetical protein